MIINGYVKDYKYAGDGTLLIKVRIPSIHGPVQQKEYLGKQVRGYVIDEDLPYYPSLLLPHLPSDGEVVAVSSLDKSNSQFMILGLTGGHYNLGATNLDL